MKGALVFVIALFAVAAMSAELDLNESNFQSTVKDNDYVLVMFFAPWCGHCKSLKPKWTEAAGKTDKYVLAKVDCTAEDGKALCEEYSIRGYPTIKFFKKGSAMDYNGPRETDGILSWLDRKSGPSAVTLESQDAIEKFVTDKKPALVGYFDGESAEQKAFFKAVDDSKLEEIYAAQVLDKKLFGDNKANTIVFTNKDGVKTFEATEDSEALAQTIFEGSFPLVQEVGGHNFQNYVSLGKPLYLLFVEPTDANKDQLVKDLEAVAAKHPKEAFTWIDAVKYRAQVKGMGASGDVVPCIIRMSSFASGNKPISLEKAGLNEEIIGEWVEGIASGKYKYVPKSEAIPTDNNGPVTTLVGKNFEDIVYDENKDVFVEFYAPWCGHCKKLAPEWETLGKTFESNENVVIAKIDSTANDVYPENAEVRGFPTLYLFKKGSKKAPVAYSGQRDADAMGKWLRTQLNLNEDGSSDDKDEL